ncbi:LOW QUALITY PROTEIN: lysine-specific demethylase 2A-like [Aplochiton taeniatus]
MDKSRFSKRLRAGTRRRYHDDGISDEEIDGKRTFNLEEKLHSNRFSSDRVKRMEGKDFTYEYIQRGGLRDPIIFERPEGLGIKMPDPDFSVNDVKIFVGSRRIVDVMDVNTQKGTEMSMAQWRRYFETPPSQRDKLYNVISLEFSHTKLENLVQRPTSVDLIDWVDNMWPRHLKERQRDSTNSITDMQYPKVQKYCLMSVQGCYTDFHIDFGGSSVWYHILRGGKVFWLIPPTPQNLELYENWVLSGKQGDIFLGDKATDCQRIELKQGFTFMIPSGWIHAVYTPVDTLVFGGNFLHSFNVPMQLNIYNIEDRTRVPTKFRYPFYFEMGWYVLERYLFSLTNTSYLIPEFQKHSLGIGGTEKANRFGPESVQVKDEEEEEDDYEDDEEEAPRAKPGVKVHLTAFELEGLWNLVGKLEALPSNKKCVPAGIHNAPALLHDIKALLKEHANDIPKLAYTGQPIITWPKRPSWYHPPPAPPPPPRPKLTNTPVAPRPQKPASSMSVLRRRRVRCKRCEACVRTECGDCNFCRDMKKFGGPGKLKQTCVLRQCLAPGLPLSAVCEICQEPNQEDSRDFTVALMECSNCAQIVHPSCLTIPGEGVVNKDLPSCWECPKCIQGITDPESSGSDDGDSGPPPPPVPPGSLKRKSSSLLDARIAKIYRRHRHSREDDDSGSDADEDGAHKKKLSLHSRRGGSASRRGYGARSRMHRRRDESEDSDDEEDDEDEDEDDEDSEEDHTGRTPVKERRRYRRRRRTRTDDEEDEEEDEDDEEFSDGQDFDLEDKEVESGEDEEDEEEEGEEEENRWDSDHEPPVLLVSDLNDDLLSGSYLTVTLQQPQRTRRHAGSIVPKLEAAVGPRSSSAGPGAQQGFIQRKAALHKAARHKNNSGGGAEAGATRGVGRPRLRGNHHQGDGGARERSPGSSSSDDSGTPPASSSSSLSPPSLLSLPSFRNAGNERGGEKEVWVAVFRYLSRAELLACMTVCKAWYKWSCDKRLWNSMDVSRCSPLSNQALAGIIKRQPTSLDLSWTPMAKQQMACLITRLPGLRELSVAGLSWCCLSAMASPRMPCLRLLDLRWCDGIKDSQLLQLLSPPGSESRSRLRNMTTLRLAGLDISDSTLRLLLRHMTLLERLDLSHCKAVTDTSLALLTASGTHTRHTLTELTLTGCTSLTDACLSYLKRLSCLTLLDLRGCRTISRRACDSFISDLSLTALFCMTEEKLIQRID